MTERAKYHEMYSDQQYQRQAAEFLEVYNSLNGWQRLILRLYMYWVKWRQVLANRRKC